MWPLLYFAEYMGGMRWTILYGGFKSHSRHMCPKCNGKRTYSECTMTNEETQSLRWFVDCDDCKKVYTVEPDGQISGEEKSP